MWEREKEEGLETRGTETFAVYSVSSHQVGSAESSVSGSLAVGL